jgi:hypothetical protein
VTEDVQESHYHEPHPHKVALVGVGRVGATFAYSLLLDGLVGELVLIDRDHERAAGEAMDLNHAVPLSHTVTLACPWQTGGHSCCPKHARGPQNAHNPARAPGRWVGWWICPAPSGGLTPRTRVEPYCFCAEAIVLWRG